MGEKDRLVGIIVTGDLVAPKATLLEPDIDWSPRIKVLRNMHARNMCLGGSLVEIGGDLIVEGTIFGHYNHGVLRVAGKTRADVILSSDYTMEFSGEVTRRYALGRVSRMNVPTDYADATLGLAVDPELLDSYGSVKEAEIIKRLSAGGSMLKAKSRIGRKSKPKVSKAGREKLAAIAGRAAAGETITEIDLVDSDLKLVPEDIGAYRELRVLRLSKNNVESLPEWVGEFPALRGGGKLRADDAAGDPRVSQAAA